MLSKLFRQELLSTYKILGTANLVLLFIVLAISLMVPDFTYLEDEMSGSYLFLLIMVLIVFETATIYTTAILLAVRYYQSMYGREAYLTHTLPVTAGTLLLSKTLAYLFWCLVNVIPIVIGSFVFLRSIHPLHLTVEAIRMFSDWMSVPALVTVLLVLLIFLCSVLSGAATTFGCINIGGQFRNHRVLAAAVAYGIFYVATQVTIVAVVNIPMVQTIADQVLNHFRNTPQAFVFLLIFSVLGLLSLFNLIFFWISWFLSSKKLNL
jgi:hypothetical protein